jgi:hypothetical protein
MLVSATTILATLTYYLLVKYNGNISEFYAWLIAVVLWILISAVKYLIMK